MTVFWNVFNQKFSRGGKNTQIFSREEYLSPVRTNYNPQCLLRTRYHFRFIITEMEEWENRERNNNNNKKTGSTLKLSIRNEIKSKTKDQTNNWYSMFKNKKLLTQTNKTREEEKKAHTFRFDLFFSWFGSFKWHFNKRHFSHEFRQMSLIFWSD